MNLIDIISPKRHGKKRFTPTFFAKSTFVISVFSFCIFVLISTILWSNDTKLDIIYPTKSGDLIISEVRSYLKDKQYISASFKEDGYWKFKEEDCGSLLNDKTFTAEYLLYGSWRVNTFYDRMRYFWRVDDETLTVRKDYTYDYARKGISVSC